MILIKIIIMALGLLTFLVITLFMLVLFVAGKVSITKIKYARQETDKTVIDVEAEVIENENKLTESKNETH